MAGRLRGWWQRLSDPGIEPERSDRRFETSSEAEAEARRLNLGERNTGYWWIEVELPDGEWTLERRYDRDLKKDDTPGGTGPPV